jgi:hypothetical protein
MTSRSRLPIVWCQVCRDPLPSPGRKNGAKIVCVMVWIVVRAAEPVSRSDHKLIDAVFWRRFER